MKFSECQMLELDSATIYSAISVIAAIPVIFLGVFLTVTIHIPFWSREKKLIRQWVISRTAEFIFICRFSIPVYLCIVKNQGEKIIKKKWKITK